jgi:L-alanine-DL-glutamate epimerase-like enolase superfamily enzyme
VDVVHPDPGTSGACRETKRIADHAHKQGIMCALHMAGSPLGSIASAHVAATLENFLAQECHALDFFEWWQQLLTKPIIDKGYIVVPDAPGLGVELNEPVVKEHLRYPGYFEPTPMYDEPILARPPGTPRGPWPHFNVDGKWVNEATSDY